VSLEAMPFTNIADLGIGLDIVQRAGRTNGGLCIDTWHHFRGADDIDLLRAVPVDRIISVQLNDGTSAPELDDYLADTITNRRVPGEGEFDLRSIIDELERKGLRAPLSVEVLSAELAALDPELVARRLGDATRALVETGDEVSRH
jgi:sugar phosphate isomerase/epimerase